MPSYVTHHIFAITVQRVTGNSIMRTAALYPAAYRWGAQGPDPLQYYHAPFTSTYARLAKRLHTASPATLFEALCAAAVAQHDTAALAYVFGFCTHYALDRVSYAFITAQAERLTLYKPGYSAIARRKLVETDLDGILIAEYISENPVQFEAYRFLDPDAAECTAFAKTLSAAVLQVLDVKLRPATVYRALHDTRRVMHLAHSGGLVQQRLHHFERLFGQAGFAAAHIRTDAPLPTDCANMEHRPWLCDGLERRESFCDLFDAAVPLAVSLQRAVLERYYQGKLLDPRFFPTNFYGERLPSLL